MLPALEVVCCAGASTGKNACKLRASILIAACCAGRAAAANGVVKALSASHDSMLSTAAYVTLSHAEDDKYAAAREGWTHAHTKVMQIISLHRGIKGQRMATTITCWCLYVCERTPITQHRGAWPAGNARSC